MSLVYIKGIDVQKILPHIFVFANIDKIIFFLRKREGAKVSINLVEGGKMKLRESFKSVNFY